MLSQTTMKKKETEKADRIAEKRENLTSSINRCTHDDEDDKMRTRTRTR